MNPLSCLSLTSELHPVLINNFDRVIFHIHTNVHKNTFSSTANDGVLDRFDKGALDCDTSGAGDKYSLFPSRYHPLHDSHSQLYYTLNCCWLSTKIYTQFLAMSALFWDKLRIRPCLPVYFKQTGSMYSPFFLLFILFGSWSFRRTVTITRNSNTHRKKPSPWDAIREHAVRSSFFASIADEKKKRKMKNEYASYVQQVQKFTRSTRK